MDEIKVHCLKQMISISLELHYPTPPPALRLSRTFDVIVYIICFITLNYLVDFRICRSTHSAVKIRTKMNFVTYMYTFLSAHFRQKNKQKKNSTSSWRAKRALLFSTEYWNTNSGEKHCELLRVFHVNVYILKVIKSDRYRLWAIYKQLTRGLEIVLTEKSFQATAN